MEQTQYTTQGYHPKLQENPLLKLGWYKCQSVDTPMHVKQCNKQEEKFYQDIVKQKEKNNDWRTSMKSLKERTSYLCCNETFSDFIVTLKFQEDKHFPAHRFILALQSDFFQRMFYGALATGEEKEHHIEASKNTTEKLLRYIYTGEVPSIDDINELSEMMHLADLYMIPSLCTICEKHAIELLNFDNAFELFQIADMFHLEELMKMCIECYNMNFEKILNSPFFVSLNIGIVKTLYDIAIKTNRKESFMPYLFNWGRSELRRKGIPDNELANLLKEFILLHIKEK